MKRKSNSKWIAFLSISLDSLEIKIQQKISGHRRPTAMRQYSNWNGIDCLLCVLRNIFCMAYPTRSYVNNVYRHWLSMSFFLSKYQSVSQLMCALVRLHMCFFTLLWFWDKWRKGQPFLSVSSLRLCLWYSLSVSHLSANQSLYTKGGHIMLPDVCKAKDDERKYGIDKKKE